MVGPKVVRAIVANVSHHFHTREHVAPPGIGRSVRINEPEHEVLLVIAQLDVELRLMLLDEVIFEQQRFLRGRYDDGFHLGRLAA